MRRIVSFAFRGLVREFRGGEVMVLLAALTIAVGSVTAIGFLTDRVSQAVAAQAAEVLAADLRLRASEPLPEEWLDGANELGAQTSKALYFPSVVYAGEESGLATVKAVDVGYPLRGTLRTAPRLLAEEELSPGLPASGEVWAEAALLARLGADVGATVELGARSFVVTRVLTYRPDQAGGFTSLAPSVLLNYADVPATGLIREGSRVTYQQLYAGDREIMAAVERYLDDRRSDDIRLQTRGEADGNLNQSIDRASRFLALASLVSLLLAAVAVAMSARRFASRRLDTAALLKSLGATQNFVLGVNLIQLLLLALVACVAGTLLGMAGEALLTTILADLLKVALPAASLRPVILGAGTAVLLLVGFALPSLATLRRSPPLRVLRHDLEPPPVGALLTYACAVVAVGLLVYWSVRDLKLVVVIIGGSLVIAALLYFAGRLLVALLSRFRSSVGVSWRYGLANVARRGQLSAIQVVAFGLGLMVLLFLTFVRNDLLSDWRGSLAENAPNRFLINIQPHELESVQSILAKYELDDADFVPLVRARMTHINGQDVTQIDFDQSMERGRGFVRREANLSFANRLQEGNEVVSGEFWSADHTGPPEVSVDEEVMRDLNLEIGDTLTYIVAGEPLTAEITSARLIQWDSFLPNFFMVFSPGALDDYPKTYVSGLFVNRDNQRVVLELARAHPSVSAIDMGAIIRQVKTVIDRAATAVQAVFFLTLFAGLVVLFAAVQSTLDERRYESALLRTFGARSSTVVAGIAAEFLALGIAAGILAALGASALGYVAATQLFNLDYRFDAILWIAGIVGGALLVGVSGLLAARSAIRSTPVEVLRG